MENADAISVKGVVNGMVSAVSNGIVTAVSNTGERLYHSGRIYIASGIKDCYISCDAMRNLRIINKLSASRFGQRPVLRTLRRRRQGRRCSMRLPAARPPARASSIPAIQRNGGQHP